jgi:hypothetical protein
MEQHPNAWDGVQVAVASVSSNVAHNWQNLVRHCGRQLHPWQRNLSSFAAGLQQQLVPLQAAQQQRQHRGQQQHYWAPALAVRRFSCLSSAYVFACMAFDSFLQAYCLPTDHNQLDLFPLHVLYACTQSISFGRGHGSSSSSQSGSNSSSDSSSLTAQPLFDLAMPKDEVKARLAPIPVYTVANPKNEFVLVAGEVRAWPPVYRMSS